MKLGFNNPYRKTTFSWCQLAEIDRQIVLDRIRELGVSAPESPPTEDLKKVLTAAAQQKLPIETLKSYGTIVPIPLEVMLETLEGLSHDNASVFVESLRVHRAAIEALRENLKHAQGEQERSEIREGIMKIFEGSQAATQLSLRWYHYVLAVLTIAASGGVALGTVALTKKRRNDS